MAPLDVEAPTLDLPDEDEACLQFDAKKPSIEFATSPDPIIEATARAGVGPIVGRRCVSKAAVHARSVGDVDGGGSLAAVLRAQAPEGDEAVDGGES